MFLMKSSRSVKSLLIKQRTISAELRKSRQPTCPAQPLSHWQRTLKVQLLESSRWFSPPVVISLLYPFTRCQQSSQVWHISYQSCAPFSSRISRWFAKRPRLKRPFFTAAHVPRGSPLSERPCLARLGLPVPLQWASARTMAYRSFSGSTMGFRKKYWILISLDFLVNWILNTWDFCGISVGFLLDFDFKRRLFDPTKTETWSSPKNLKPRLTACAWMTTDGLGPAWSFSKFAHLDDLTIGSFGSKKNNSNVNEYEIFVAAAGHQTLCNHSLEKSSTFKVLLGTDVILLAACYSCLILSQFWVNTLVLENAKGAWNKGPHAPFGQFGFSEVSTEYGGEYLGKVPCQCQGRNIFFKQKHATDICAKKT